jgi:hypothetical protein
MLRALAAGVLSLPVVEWTMIRGDAEVVCIRRDTARGIELSVTFSGLPTAQYLTRTLAEARELMEKVRRGWEAAGWAPFAASAPHSN